MSNGWLLPEDVLRDAPSYAPRPAELADLQLLLSGAYAPLTGFMSRADLTSLSRRGRLADGTPWPVPVTLQVPAALADGLDPADPARRAVVLTDGEGAPVAAMDVTDVWPGREGLVGVGGAVRRLGDGGHGPFQRLRRGPGRGTRPAAAGPGARGLRRPSAAPPATGADRARGPHARRAPAGADPGGRGVDRWPAVRGAGAYRVRRPRPDAPGDAGGGAAGPPARRDQRRAAAGPGRRRVRRDPPALHRGHALRRRPACAGAPRAGLRQPGRAVALAGGHPAAQPPAGAERGGDRRPAGPGLPAARVAHPAGGGEGTGPGPPAAAVPGTGDLPDRAVRLGQVDDRPGPGRRAP